MGMAPPVFYVSRPLTPQVFSLAHLFKRNPALISCFQIVTIFCVDIDQSRPDLVLIDFSVNDYGHPKYMDTLLRKVLSLPSHPVVALVNLWVHQHCPVTRYLLHSFYYNLPVLNMCPAVNLCYGKGHMPKHISDLYSKTDGVHPWGAKGVQFLGDILFAWWKRTCTMLTHNTYMDTDGREVLTHHSFDQLLNNQTAKTSSDYTNIATQALTLPPPLYVDQPLGICTRCITLSDDADGRLAPVGTPEGFRIISKVKVGYGGFNSDSSGATKSVKRSWLADKPGSHITFKFYGTAVQVAIWQRRDGMGILSAHVDNDKSKIAKASGFFKGYTWAMERNNTGRSEIIPLFDGLTDGLHTITFTVSDKPANPFVPGHVTQIFAVLSASDNRNCKKMVKTA